MEFALPAETASEDPWRWSWAPGATPEGVGVRVEGVEDDDEDKFLADDPPFFLAEPVDEALMGFMVFNEVFRGEKHVKRGFAQGRKGCGVIRGN